MTPAIVWVSKVRRVWSILLAGATAILGVADQFLPALQGIIPPMGYVALAIALAVLPSIIDRRRRGPR